jgi:acyl-coenzyme A synthetase/AMP-(fatty) acid ligase
VINHHENVLESCVVGIPDERWGEAILALVMLKQGKTATEQELIEHCRQQVASFKKPKRVEFVQDFPRTPLQKIKKINKKIGFNVPSLISCYELPYDENFSRFKAFYDDDK